MSMRGIEQLENRRLLTVLPFVPATGNFVAGSALPRAYGDRVTAAVQGGFKYGTTGGATPNVTADYGTNGKTVTARVASFGDLSGVASTANHAPFEMTLTADAGYKVSLSSFDLAGAVSHDWTIKSVQVLDGNNNVLFSKATMKIEGDAAGARHSNFSFATPLSASKLKIRFDASNISTSTAAIGLDNVQFSQVKVAPAPASVTGTVFNDLNRDASRAANGEAGLSGRRVFVDANNDGVWQTSETSALTDSAGNYALSLAPGSYHLNEVLPSGWKRISPTTGFALALTAGQKATGKGFADAQISLNPTIVVGKCTAAVNSTATVKLNVFDDGNIAAQDIEGMTFTIQIDGGGGTTPSIKSVDLLTGTVWAGHNSGVFVPAGGSEPQFKTFSVLTGSDGDHINANGLLATVTFDTTGAVAGSYSIKLIGTKIAAFDTQFQNHVGSPVSAVISNGTLTVN